VCVADAKRTPSTLCAWGPSRIFPSNNLGLRLSGVGGKGGEGPAQPVGLCASPTRSALGSCWRHKGHLVALLGSLNNSRMTVQCKAPRRQVPLKGNGSLTDQRAEHPAGCERIVPIRALLFPPRSLSGALFRRPNSHHSGESGNVGPNLKYFLSVPPWRAR
jgi:hypothetical protein